MDPNERIQQLERYVERDDLMVHLLPGEGQPRSEDDDEDRDLEYFPTFGALQPCSDLGERWASHCRAQLQPAYMGEYEKADPQYQLVHMVRVLDLARRCGLKVNVIGTNDDLDKWDAWMKKLAEDAETFNAVNAQGGATMVGGPGSFLWLDAFKPIRKPRSVPQRGLAR
jgi:hypothetical protein